MVVAVVMMMMTVMVNGRERLMISLLPMMLW